MSNFTKPIHATTRRWVQRERVDAEEPQKRARLKERVGASLRGDLRASVEAFAELVRDPLGSSEVVAVFGTAGTDAAHACAKRHIRLSV